MMFTYFYMTFLSAIFIGGEVFAFPPRVVPKSTIAQVGTSVRFNCTSHLNEPIYWSTIPFGSQYTNEIYMGEGELLNGYGTSGRFSVIEDRSQRRYDLAIENVEKSDAGNYICTDQKGLGKKAYAELVVTNGLTCEATSSTDGYVGENVFELKQDIIRFSCKMNYTGNLHPSLDWFQGESTKAVDSEASWDPRSKILTSQVALVAKSNLNGVNITCKARLTSGDLTAAVGHTSKVTWTSKPIYVKYAVLKQKEVTNCPGLEWALDCNPPCLYQLEYNSTGSPSCHITYATGNSTYTRTFPISNGRSRDAQNLNGFTIALICLFVIVTVICGIFIVMYMYIKTHRPTTRPSNVQEDL